jgi:predicted transcriptional regulator
MLNSQAAFVAAVNKSLQQADRGEFVEHKQVLDRIDTLFLS